MQESNRIHTFPKNFFFFAQVRSSNEVHSNSNPAVRVLSASRYPLDIRNQFSYSFPHKNVSLCAFFLLKIGSLTAFTSIFLIFNVCFLFAFFRHFLAAYSISSLITLTFSVFLTFCDILKISIVLVFLFYQDIPSFYLWLLFKFLAKMCSQQSVILQYFVSLLRSYFSYGVGQSLHI